MKRIFRIVPILLGLMIIAVSCEQPVPVAKVEVSETELTMDAGKTAELTATVLPLDATEKAIVWSSADVKVVSVDGNGKITAVAPGKTAVRATAPNGLYAECMVTVIRRAEGIALSETEKTIDVGKDFTLTATVSPADTADKSVTWTTENADIASVDKSGKVTGIAPGTVKITATSTDGEFTASCSVTVLRRAESITLSASEQKMEVGGSFTLTATVLPEDASDKKVTWSSSAPEIASVDENGKVTGVSKGTAVITASGDNGKKAECSVTVYIAPDTITLSDAEVFLNAVYWDDELRHEQTVTATVLPAAADQNVTWESSNPELVTVENGLIKAQRWQEGTAVITARTVDGKEAECTVYVGDAEFDMCRVGTDHSMTSGNTWEGGYDLQVKFTYSVPELGTKTESVIISGDPNLISIEGDILHLAEVEDRIDTNYRFVNEKMGIDIVCPVTICPKITSIFLPIPTDQPYMLKGDPRLEEQIVGVLPERASKIVDFVYVEEGNPHGNQNIDGTNIGFGTGISHFYFESPFSSDVRTPEYDFMVSAGNLDRNGMWHPEAGDNGIVYIPNRSAVRDPSTKEIMTVETKGIFDNYYYEFWTTPPAGKGIDEVRIPDPYASFTVGRQAFRMSNLKKINIPSNATVDSDAFEGCGELHSVFVGKNVTVDPSAFAGCTALKTIWMEGADTGTRPAWAPADAAIVYGKTLDEFYPDMWKPGNTVPEV